LTHPNFVLNPWFPNAISTPPPSDSAAYRRSISASSAQSTYSETAGVNPNPCSTALSMHMNSCPASVKIACVTDPSAPGPSGPYFVSDRTSASANSDR
jgi:hypothetical protein